MIGRTRCHFASSSSVGRRPVFLSGFGAVSVVRTAYLVPAGNRTLLQEATHAADRLAEAPGRAEHVQVRRRQLGRAHVADVMDVDTDTVGGHQLLELSGDRGPVAELRGVQVLDLHGEPPNPSAEHTCS